MGGPLCCTLAAKEPSFGLNRILVPLVYLFQLCWLAIALHRASADQNQGLPPGCEDPQTIISQGLEVGGVAPHTDSIDPDVFQGNTAAPMQSVAGIERSADGRNDLLLVQRASLVPWRMMLCACAMLLVLWIVAFLWAMQCAIGDQPETCFVNPAKPQTPESGALQPVIATERHSAKMRLTVSEEVDVTWPYARFRPHVIGCSMGHVFVANKFQVLWGIAPGRVAPALMSCGLDKAIDDIAATCDGKSYACCVARWNTLRSS